MDMDMFIWAAPDRNIERRLDITISRVADAIELMSDEARKELAGKPWFAAICILQRVRAMERGEEDVLGHPIKGGLAETYDAVVTPGEDIIPALLKTFQAHLK